MPGLMILLRDFCKLNVNTNVVWKDVSYDQEDESLPRIYWDFLDN